MRNCVAIRRTCSADRERSGLDETRGGLRMRVLGVTWPAIEVETPIEVESRSTAAERRWLRLLLAAAAETFFFVGLLAAVGLVSIGLALLLLPVAAAIVVAAAWTLSHRPRLHGRA